MRASRRSCLMDLLEGVSLGGLSAAATAAVSRFAWRAAAVTLKAAIANGSEKPRLSCGDEEIQPSEPSAENTSLSQAEPSADDTGPGEVYPRVAGGTA